MLEDDGEEILEEGTVADAHAEANAAAAAALFDELEAETESHADCRLAVNVPPWFGSAYGPDAKREFAEAAGALTRALNVGQVVAAYCPALPFRRVAGRGGQTAGEESGLFFYLEVELADPAEAAAALDVVRHNEEGYGKGSLDLWFPSTMFRSKGRRGQCELRGLSVVAASDVQRLAPPGLFLFGHAEDTSGGRVWRSFLEGLSPRMRDMATSAMREPSAGVRFGDAILATTRVWWAQHDPEAGREMRVLRCVPDFEYRTGPKAKPVATGWVLTWWFPRPPGCVPLELKLGSKGEWCRVHWPIPSAVKRADWAGARIWGPATVPLSGSAKRGEASVPPVANRPLPPPRKGSEKARLSEDEQADKLTPEQRKWYDALLAGEVGTWVCTRAARWTVRTRRFSPCDNARRHEPCANGAPCDGTGCQCVPVDFWGAAGEGQPPEQRKERGGERKDRIRKEMMSEPGPREPGPGAATAAAAAASSADSALRAAHKRPAVDGPSAREMRLREEGSEVDYEEDSGEEDGMAGEPFSDS